MSRPLTVADRAPEVGDVVESTVFGRIEVRWPNEGVYMALSGPNRVILRPHYRYVSRYDGGPITIDD